MSMNIKPKWHGLLVGIILLCLVALIILIMPQRSGKFNYYFEIGKPWGYSLLTANQDFPIFKTEAQLQAERQKLLDHYLPYYALDAETQNNLDQLLQTEKFEKLSNKQKTYIKNQLISIFSQGVIDAQDLQTLNDSKYDKIMLISNKNIAEPVEISQLFTPRTAYEKIKEAPLLSNNAIKNIDLYQIITPNIRYDELTSKRVKEQLLSSISLTQGVVQAGERIIDRGEIVTERSFQILNSLKKVQEEQSVDAKQARNTLLGNIILIICFVGLLVLYLYAFRKDVLLSIRNVLFFSSLILLLTATSGILLRFSELSLYVVPFVWVIVLVRVFYDTRTAFQTHLLTCLIVSLFVPTPFEFLILQISVGLVCLPCLKEMTQRSQLAITSIWVFLTYSVIYSAFTWSTTGSFLAINPWIYLLFIANSSLLLMSYGLIFLYEKIFGYVSSISLIELTNVNSSLMLTFAEKAPGTFQHSLQVSNLATEAAKRIGANALLVRAGALYHDIGKLAAPQNFTENQTDGYNPLSALPHQQSAQTVISHVAEGIKLAKKHKLPKTIISFIATHHGTSKVRYFYNSYVNEHPNEQVDEALFSYPGPKPTTKETAILMMADAVEARSRSMKEYTEENIKEMVDQMTNIQISDGQFSETPLSFKDVEDIKQVFVERLVNIYHHRISYPEINKNN